MSDSDPTDDTDPIVTESDLDWNEYDHGERAFRRKQLGA
ncbi:cupin, partial [Halobacteriales archaeon QH_8_67_27]